MENINLQDKSGDKDYFTIIPNYVLNHSALWDREVYIQMKRIAGENGKCYISMPKLAKKCGIGKERLNKSIKYLIKSGWIKYVGKTPVMTKGGEQLINTYEIKDIWKLNNKFYGGGRSGDSPNTGGVAVGIAPIASKGGSPQGRKEELREEERNTPPKISKILLDTFLQEMNLIRPDGDYTTDNLFPAKEIAKYITEIIIEDNNNSQINGKKEINDTEITKSFIGLLRKMDDFHRKNATSLKYIKYNFNKILNTLKK